MSSNNRRKKRQRDLYRRQPLSTSAIAAGQASSEHKPEMQIFAFAENSIADVSLQDVSEVTDWIGKYEKVWLDVSGNIDMETVKDVGKLLKFHELAMADVVSPVLRAKVEVYDKQLFIALRSATWAKNGAHMEQLSIFMGPGFVVTFQDRLHNAAIEQVRDRLRQNVGHLRAEGVDYLMYTIVDAVIDAYFPVVEGLGDELDHLEDEILEQIKKSTPARILELKRDILAVRRSIWPGRDVLNRLGRDDMSEFISAKTRTYLRDCYDHANRIIDLVETHREMCADLMDLYLSSVSNRMNEVMKVLTTITLLFMPPSLIAAIYGMNFDRSSPFNLPELSWKYGYYYCLGLMLVTALLVYYYGRHRGWLGAGDTVAD